MNDYIRGLEKGREIASRTERGKIAAEAILREITKAALEEEVFEKEVKQLLGEHYD